MPCLKEFATQPEAHQVLLQLRPDKNHTEAPKLRNVDKQKVHGAGKTDNMSQLSVGDMNVENRQRNNMLIYVLCRAELRIQRMQLATNLSMFHLSLP